MNLKRFLKLCVITVTATLIILIPFLWSFLPQYYFISTANGESMQPTLPLNGIRVYKMTKEIEVGDVILFDDGTELVGHRLLNVSYGRYYCKGDGNAHRDFAISGEQIKGKLVFSCSRRAFNDFFGGIIEVSIVGLFLITRKITRGD